MSRRGGKHNRACTAPTTGHTPTLGQTVPRRPSAARRTRTGRELFACHCSCAGREDRSRRRIERDRPPQRLAADLPCRRRGSRYRDKAASSYEAAGKTFKVHIDGYNLLPYLTGQAAKSPRKEFIYFDDDGNLVAVRFDNWKVVFMEQRAQGTMRIWGEPFVVLRLPKLFNLRTDPFEHADVTSNTYYDWFLDHDYICNMGGMVIRAFLSTLADFPPRQKPASFTLDQGLMKMEQAAASGLHH